MSHEGPTPGLGAGHPLAAPRGGVAASGTPSTSPPDNIKAPNLKQRAGRCFSTKEFRYIAATTRNPNPGTKNSVLAPCRDGELEEIIAIIITDASPSTIHDSPIHV